MLCTNALWLHNTSVEIGNGTITGRRFNTSINNGQGFEFLGIPYATPPIQELRFEKPRPLKYRWHKPFVATRARHKCIQVNHDPKYLAKKYSGINVTESEDCLNLNIWSPRDVNSTTLRSVMVWIHGGSYVNGDGYPNFNGRMLSTMGDVVVVTIQYRLGVFGFLRVNNIIDGNMGLWDQQMALKWVNENIRHFGGDPDSVTVFGSSAGAMSISLHLLNVESSKYFKRAILQSGTAVSRYAVDNNAMHYTLNQNSFISKVGCNKNTPTEQLACLKCKDSSILAIHSAKAYASQPVHTWAPVLDGNFIKNDPSSILKNRKMTKKDLMIGIMADEMGSFTNGYIFHELRKSGLSRSKFFSTQMKKLFRKMYGHLSQVLAKYSMRKTVRIFRTIKRHIFSSNVCSTSKLNETTFNDYMNQALFECPLKETADAYLNIDATVYKYLINYRPSMSKYASTIGPTHNDELDYLFGHFFIYQHPIKITEADQRFSKRLINEWSSFAKTGRPESLNWKPMSSRKDGFYELKEGQSSSSWGRQILDRKNDSCGFWSSLNSK